MVSKTRKEQIEREVQSILFTYFLIFLAFVGGVWGFSVWGIYAHVKNITQDIIASQFEEPQIQKLLQDVAANQAKEIIVNTLNPEIAKINETIKKSRLSLETEIEEVKKETQYFRDYLEGSKLSFSKEFDALAEQVNNLQQRDIFASLADEAMSKGSASAYEKLLNYKVDDKYKNAKLSEILRVKNYYSTMTRIKGISIVAIDPDGTKVKDSEISTNILLKDLATNKNWKIRAKAAQLLGKRKEDGVKNALMQSAKTDSRLDVRKISFDSLERIGDVQFPDVLDYQCNIPLLLKEKQEGEINEEYQNNKIDDDLNLQNRKLDSNISL